MKRYNDNNYKNYSQEITLHWCIQYSGPIALKSLFNYVTSLSSQHRALPQYHVSFIGIVL
jgi:hypothetical protein